MKLSGIYKIESKIKPNRFYIGSSVNISQRWTNHLSLLKNNKHHNKILQNHYNKYGKDDLLFSIILECDNAEKLVTIEQSYLDDLCPYFNIRKIAENNFGCKWAKPKKNKYKIKKEKFLMYQYDKNKIEKFKNVKEASKKLLIPEARIYEFLKEKNEDSLFKWVKISYKVYKE